MQDDLSDGVVWAVGQGIADPARVCIGGANYGGYATLMGLVRNPGLYKCGVAWASITDIGMLFDDSWADPATEVRRYTARTMIADPVADAEQLKETSPLEQAARITQPLLLAHGGADSVTLFEDAVKFRKAVRQNNFNVEWAEYPDEGHGWRLASTRIDFWTKVEKFLERNLGRGSR
jgi:dipeptidyl aminopeptidase/acylaminoacyl peptidase